VAAWRGVYTASAKIRELLGSHSLDEEVPVVQGLEVNLDDVGVALVDPHVLNSNFEY